METVSKNSKNILENCQEVVLVKVLGKLIRCGSHVLHHAFTDLKTGLGDVALSVLKGPYYRIHNVLLRGLVAIKESLKAIQVESLEELVKSNTVLRKVSIVLGDHFERGNEYGAKNLVDHLAIHSSCCIALELVYDDYEELQNLGISSLRYTLGEVAKNRLDERRHKVICDISIVFCARHKGLNESNGLRLNHAHYLNILMLDGNLASRHYTLRDLTAVKLVHVKHIKVEAHHVRAKGIAHG
mmetsp:Transcript_2462/g.5638  ORF Transcript_2462/g.5638 Transcript_2462/m.5638 type:complete len:242 (+) Transcript_2462:714-1439(+)